MCLVPAYQAVQRKGNYPIAPKERKIFPIDVQFLREPKFISRTLAKLFRKIDLQKMVK
jgi:hypothetical protein